MAHVKIYAKAISGSEHVPSDHEEPKLLFVPWVEVNGEMIRTESPAFREWCRRGHEGILTEDEEGISLDLSFMVLRIRHADDRTWEFLQTLDANDFGENSTREEFCVLVDIFEFVVMEPVPDYV